MNEFDNAVKKITDLFYSAARKSGELLENTKTSYNISVEKDKIGKLQSQIGQKFWQIYKDGGEVPDFILSDLEAIKLISENIEALEKNLSENRLFKVCLACGAKLELESVYCPKCGERQAKPDDGGQAE
ncbi:MAG: zinc-ribbon domain-containing protein [Clostridiales bacterium]|jgi:ribosomal protein L40E|nr:zinc-ribbon domain-containing protein [Clostridiales bacterium]